MATLPLEHLHDLTTIPVSGYELDVVPGADELRALAEWAGVDEVTRLNAHVSVRAQSRTRFLEEAEFEADIVQSCVVTLQPVRTHIARDFTRVLNLTPGARHFADKASPVSAASVAEDTPDEIDSPVYDLGTPLREELALAIDPYPRAPGVAFEAPADDDHTESPFSVLKKMQHGS